MTTYDYKQDLQKRKINIHQMEDILNNEFDKLDKFFEVSFSESVNFWKTKKAQKKKFNQKVKNSDKAFKDFNEYVDGLISQIDNPELNFDENEMTERFENIKNATEDLWNEEDKIEIIKIVSTYYNLNARNNAGIKIVNRIINNEFIKSLLQLIIFFTSFIVSFWISLKLEFLEENFGKFFGQFIIASIIFLTLEKILDYVKDELMYWRVKKLHFSLLAVRPLVEKTKGFLHKNII